VKPDSVPDPPQIPTEHAVESDLDRELAALGAHYQGRLGGLDRARKRGHVELTGGRKVPIVFSALDLRGEGASPRRLRNGMRVTFDVVNTEDGPRVNRIWVGHGPWEHPRV